MQKYRNILGSSTIRAGLHYESCLYVSKREKIPLRLKLKLLEVTKLKDHFSCERKSVLFCYLTTTKKKKKIFKQNQLKLLNLKGFTQYRLCFDLDVFKL